MTVQDRGLRRPHTLFNARCGHLDIQSLLDGDPNFHFVLDPTNPVVTLVLPSGSSHLAQRRTLNGTPISGHEKGYEEVN